MRILLFICHDIIKLLLASPFALNLNATIVIGYGDKVPRSIVGRIMGMIWTMFGICLISLFTASVTNVMWECIFGGMSTIPIQGSDVGVINGSIERQLVLQQGGNPIGTSMQLYFMMIENFKIYLTSGVRRRALSSILAFYSKI